ncbi:MAG: M23 family metallopeptidase, partial [Deltaproteobacteria bacterium]|nr:M23 family metallopeptidase [Deltaproteobacteria bacterium]
RGGLFVIIDHKGGLQSGYFHLKDFAIRSGQRVRKGQFIGTVGRTGIKKTRPHLHFELRRVRRKWKSKIDSQPYFGADAIAMEKTYFGEMMTKRRKLRRRRAGRHYVSRKAKLRKAKRRRYAARKAKLRKAKVRRAKLRRAKLRRAKARRLKRKVRAKRRAKRRAS